MKKCIIIGASHGGVMCAFALRREGWEGEIVLIDSDEMIPYRRPPLSKAYLTSSGDLEEHYLKTPAVYESKNITLKLGQTVTEINRKNQTITIGSNEILSYDKLVFATGARPFLPPFTTIEALNFNVFPMRTAQDAIDIREAFIASEKKRVVVIGGGYIGLETAASLRKLGGKVTVLEREKRVLTRVTTPFMSDFFHQLHTEKGVNIFTNKNVVSINQVDNYNEIVCANGSRFEADLIVVGVGIRVNLELAKAANLEIENGIKVNAQCQTNDENIYAIGDCTFHYNIKYDKWLRLESVQNANDQAKTAAAAIVGKSPVYDAIPWFWSDQYDVKLQMVGLSDGFTDFVIRKETDRENCFSIWYFDNEKLLAVDAVNNGKAYMLGMKYLKSGQQLDKEKLADVSVPFKPKNFIK